MRQLNVVVKVTLFGVEERLRMCRVVELQKWKKPIRRTRKASVGAKLVARLKMSVVALAGLRLGSAVEIDARSVENGQLELVACALHGQEPRSPLLIAACKGVSFFERGR